jgi:hypothetical protein
VVSRISRDNNHGRNSNVKHKARIKAVDNQLKESRLYLNRAFQAYLKQVRPVNEPLVLISQIQRSGGSMLSQLFDGHPRVHAHPHELKVGYPKKYIWPEIDLNDSPEKWFEILFEDSVVEHLRSGYKKMAKYEESFLFVFAPSLQRRIFLQYLNSIGIRTRRAVFNAYMTSYFGAWVNNQNRLGSKKFVVAFTPRLSMMKANMKSFFSIYPDGRLINIVRDPKNWFPSATRHRLDKYGDIEHALAQWLDSAESMLQNKQLYGDRVCIITFEDLVGRTQAVMRYLAELLPIDFDEILLTPTFNKIPIKPNTSFKLENPGIMTSALERYKSLSRQELEVIEDLTGSIYEKVLGVAAVI